ncbi:MAG: MoaD/ThiS family protein [Coriobacteriia bacterium]|nr:MoaD/ThiS family protein [Coriobacteriia bacterium]
MHIEVALFAHLSEFQPDGRAGRGARPFDVAEGTTIGDIIEMLALPDEPRVLFVNNKHATEQTVLAQGDRLAIFPPVAGG